MLSEERASIVRRAAQRSPADSTFLSHSSKDVKLLSGIIRVLEGHGAQVYVDKSEDTPSLFTSGDTAITLRRRTAACRKFILFAIKSSQDSR